MRKTAKVKLKAFDKYYYYRKSVQSPDVDVEFFRDVYRSLRGKSAQLLREDFCGTFSVCCEWTKLGRLNVAHGVDLDKEPLQYGFEHYWPNLTPSQQRRLHIHHANVLSPKLPKVDIICALNFSYFIFKERQQLKKYFHNCLKTLRGKGILIADCLGGSSYQHTHEEKVEHRTHDYFWDLKSFNPIDYDAQFSIHFKRPGEKKRLDVFTYDWRLWTLPELRDLLYEVGFKRVETYWEGTMKNGEGDGDFKPTARGDECESWLAYLVAEA